MKHPVQRRLARWLGCAAACGATLISASGCSYGCLDIACNDVLELRFEPSLRQPGQYAFELNVGGQQRRCTLTFDPARREPGEGECDGLFVRGSNVPSGGNAVTEGAPFEIVGFELAPTRSVSVAVYRDGALLANRDITPRYEHRSVDRSCSECDIAIARVPVP